MRLDAPALGARVGAAGDAVCTASDVGSDVETLTPQAESNTAINAGIAARLVITFTPCRNARHVKRGYSKDTGGRHAGLPWRSSCRNGESKSPHCLLGCTPIAMAQTAANDVADTEAAAIPTDLPTLLAEAADYLPRSGPTWPVRKSATMAVPTARTWEYGIEPP